MAYGSLLRAYNDKFSFQTMSVIFKVINIELFNVDIDACDIQELESGQKNEGFDKNLFGFTGAIKQLYIFCHGTKLKKCSSR